MGYIHTPHRPVPLSHVKELICYIRDSYFSKPVPKPCSVSPSSGMDIQGVWSTPHHITWPRPVVLRVWSQPRSISGTWTLTMHFVGSHSGPTDAETLKVEPRGLTSPPGDYDVHESWRTREHRTSQGLQPWQHIQITRGDFKTSVARLPQPITSNFSG